MRHSLGHTRGYRARIYGELSQPRGLVRRLARRSRDHNTMFYRVLLGIIIIILLEISCDSRDSRQDSKDSGKIPRFQRDSWSCRCDSESCRTPRSPPVDRTNLIGCINRLLWQLLTWLRKIVHQRFRCTQTCWIIRCVFIV